MIVRWVRIGSMLACGLGVSGCPDAKVDAFSATPNYVYPKKTVALSWRVEGTATLVATPPVPLLVNAPVPDHGDLSVQPETTTDFVLSVTRPPGSATSSTQRVRVGGDGPARATEATLDDEHHARCANGKVSTTTSPQHFDDKLTIASVDAVPGDEHTYAIDHLGRHATVRAGAPSTEIAGLPVGGDWVFTVNLLDGERCADRFGNRGEVYSSAVADRAGLIGSVSSVLSATAGNSGIAQLAPVAVPPRAAPAPGNMGRQNAFRTAASNLAAQHSLEALAKFAELKQA